MRLYSTKKEIKGFTLLEILLVVGIIAVLAGIVILAINPSKSLATVRNTERKSDIKEIDSALSQYYIDNTKYPTSTDSGLQEVCNTGSVPYPHIGIDCTGYLDLSILVPTYLTAIPRDALASTTLSTGYRVYQHQGTKKIQLIASNAELGVVIAIGTTTIPSVGGGSLQWSPSFGLKNWYAAKAFCEDPINGYTRLPTIDELGVALTNQFINLGNNPGGFLEYNNSLLETQYHSGTEASSDSVYSGNYGYYEGYYGHSATVVTTNIDSKSSWYNTRCVR